VGDRPNQLLKAREKALVSAYPKMNPDIFASVNVGHLRKLNGKG